MTTNTPDVTPALPSAPSAPSARPVRLLRRSPDRILGGVAGGLTDFFGAPLWLGRVLFVLAGLAGWGIPLYLILWLVVPERGSDHGALDGLFRRTT